ncbi:MAG: RNA-guided endonuclease TnpB family protein [Erysipelotrichaceae bacterium]|nr:RNA-guided endonuclease TnpB family protein [Erysipelotrichaceae bacterium]
MSYSTIQFNIKQGDDFYKYCDDVTHVANNLRNATLFRIRQIFTLTHKDRKDWTPNELEIYEEACNAARMYPKDCFVPDKNRYALTYTYLEKMMRANKNPDYFDKRMAMQISQQVLKCVVNEMDSFYKSLESYYNDDSKFKAKPKLPKYKKSGSKYTTKLTNQDCVIYSNADGTHSVKLPLIKKRYNIGDTPVEGKKLKEARIIPYHDIYILSLVFEDVSEVEMVSEKPKRICAIDLGVNNFAAITNNIGKECLLFKGEVIKSKNQWYNKQISKLKSEQTAGTPGKSQKFVSTPESDKLCVYRDAWMSDYMHKCAKRIIDWCKENSIDTIIVGENKEWKQNIDTGKKNNQTFVSIPFNTFKAILEYLCERNGIRFIKQEESYTSKASFLDNDEIPVYKANDTKKYRFSGKRAPTTFSNEFGEHSRDNGSGYRGLYKTRNGTIINSDLNGSANIGRKCIPDMFTMEGAILPDFKNVKAYKHPDEYFEKENREKQLKMQSEKGISKSKQRRINKKEKKLIAKAV